MNDLLKALIAFMVILAITAWLWPPFAPDSKTDTNDFALGQNTDLSAPAKSEGLEVVKSNPASVPRAKEKPPKRYVTCGKHPVCVTEQALDDFFSAKRADDTATVVSIARRGLCKLLKPGQAFTVVDHGFMTSEFLVAGDRYFGPTEEIRDCTAPVQ